MSENQKETLPQEERRYRRRRKMVSLLSLLILLLFFAAVTVWIGGPLLEMLGDPDEFRSWVDSHSMFGRLIFIGMVILQVIVAVIPGEPMEIGAGYAFGAVEGTILCLVGTAIGSSLVFLFTKKLGIRMVEAFISREKLQSLQFLQNAERLNLVIFLAFLIPGTPKDILTYFAGLTPIRLRTFLLLTSLARIPSVVSSTLGGNALGTENYGMAVVVFLVTAVISAIGALIYKQHTQKKQMKEGDTDSSVVDQ
ncbi:TVP38/TMEM64 family protein [Anaeromassilibacillus sp. An200]|uniref:TVP38/TMEM64 family protein n=1 Tax=Anaeromassilibacillus sp. An200 TaxID=1965587 RepID=UPI000B3B04F6|nr:TVP38/TMEM64 family protein [Anaeromassilibacillus sp. An200]OUP13192.1 TVP38/TMEM64 family protein [Anaeromassilibacillus sp. An200]